MKTTIPENSRRIGIIRRARRNWHAGSIIELDTNENKKDLIRKHKKKLYAVAGALAAPGAVGTRNAYNYLVRKGGRGAFMNDIAIANNATNARRGYNEIIRRVKSDPTFDSKRDFITQPWKYTGKGVPKSKSRALVPHDSKFAEQQLKSISGKLKTVPTMKFLRNARNTALKAEVLKKLKLGSALAGPSALYASAALGGLTALWNNKRFYKWRKGKWDKSRAAHLKKIESIDKG